MAAKRRRTQEQIDAITASEAEMPTVQELAITTAAFRQNLLDVRAMITVMTASIDDHDKSVTDMTSRLRLLEEHDTSRFRQLQDIERKLENAIIQQDYALQEMQDSIAKFVFNADQAVEQQKNDHAYLVQEVGRRLQDVEDKLEKITKEQEQCSRAVNINIDANDTLTSALENVRNDLIVERQAMLASFIDDMKLAVNDMQLSLQKQLELTKATAEEQLRTALNGVSESIRTEFNKSLAANKNLLTEVLNEAQKFNAFRRKVLGHNNRPLKADN